MRELRDIVERASRAICGYCREPKWKAPFSGEVEALKPVRIDGFWYHPISIKGKVSKSPARCYANNIRNEFRAELPDEWDATRNQQEPCACGHPYERHFDSYEEMGPVGCKYCECVRFTAKV